MMKNQSATDLKNTFDRLACVAGEASVELVLRDVIAEREEESAQWVDDLTEQVLINRLEGGRARPAFIEFRSLR